MPSPFCIVRCPGIFDPGCLTSPPLPCFQTALDLPAESLEDPASDVRCQAVTALAAHCEQCSSNGSGSDNQLEALLEHLKVLAVLQPAIN